MIIVLPCSTVQCIDALATLRPGHCFSVGGQSEGKYLMWFTANFLPLSDGFFVVQVFLSCTQVAAETGLRSCCTTSPFLRSRSSHSVAVNKNARRVVQLSCCALRFHLYMASQSCWSCGKFILLLSLLYCGRPDGIFSERRILNGNSVEWRERPCFFVEFTFRSCKSWVLSLLALSVIAGEGVGPELL